MTNSEEVVTTSPRTVEVVSTPTPAASVDRISAAAYDPYAGRRRNAPRLVQASGSVLEVHSLGALVVYALLAWLLGKLTWLIVGESWSAVTTSATSVETRA